MKENMTDEASIPKMLRARRKTILLRLSKVAPEDVKEIEALDKALDAYLSVAPNDPSTFAFASYKAAIDAIEACLTLKGTWTRETELVDALMRGGFQEESPRRQLNITDSIRHWTGKGKRIIRQPRHPDFIGLPEWIKK
jgi:hypothetical protein